MVSRFALVTFYIVGMLLFGSLNTITVKVQFTMSSISITGQEKLFRFPWLATFNMFVGMSFALIAQRIVKSLCRRPAVMVPEGSADQLLNVDEHVAKPSSMSYSKKIALLSIPSAFDLAATALCSCGMLFMPASIWQMLRGAEIFFTTLISVIFLKRKLFGFNYLGLFFCVIGVTCVGLSNVWGSDAQPGSDGNRAHVFLGMALVLAGQVVQAAQMVAEEWFITEVDLPEIDIVGYEGFWGLLMMVVIVYPILYCVPGNDNGHLEDPFDALTMLWNSPGLTAVVLTYTFSCAGYNVFGIAITGALSAIHRTMMEASRTLVIWFFGLFVHYAVNSDSMFGEAWTAYSWLEAVGFVFILTGQSIYGEVIKVPCLYYPTCDTEVEHFVSPGSLKNLGSPLPRHEGTSGNDGGAPRKRTLSS